MSKHSVVKLSGREVLVDPLTELLRRGAEQLIYQAVEAELKELLTVHSERRTEAGKAGVVRNGYLPKRELQTGLGPVTVRIPKVRAKSGEPVTFRSALVPPYVSVRKSKSLEAALPGLYLKGISSGERGEALKVLVGAGANGLSSQHGLPPEADLGGGIPALAGSASGERSLGLSMEADGIDSGLRAEQVKLCALVVIGVNERGEKRFLAIEDGVRESTQSWREVLLKLKSRGLNAPELAIGDGALGFWAALEEVYPETCQQRCWRHKTMNVLNPLPKSVQAKAKQSLHEIWQAETRREAEKAFDLFLKTYEPNYPKATICLHKDREAWMAFYDFPAQHWQSIRTSNPIESTFGTIRHRTQRSKGCLSHDGMLHMMFKLGQCAEKEMATVTRF
jgi:putative transposase